MAVLAVVATVAAVWITLRADFLAYPGWLAVQKADLIVGPIAVGLYWRHRRPDNRLGLLLITLGLLAIPYIGESTSSPGVFTVGTTFEYAIEAVTVAVILAFPNGRLGWAEWVILAVWLLGAALPSLLFVFVGPQFPPFFSISGCRALCPANPVYSSSLYVSTASWVPVDIDIARAAAIFTWLATAGLLVRRFVAGTPPRRRALAIGAPIAMFYLLASAAYQAIQLFSPQDARITSEPATTAVQWVVAASRSAVWYGFLFALIAAELFAARVLRDVVRRSVVVRRSLGPPTLGELERMLRAPLGDQGLRLGFWHAETSEWVGADGWPIDRPEPGQESTVVDRGAHPAAVIVHDAQLSEDPELLQAAGSAVLLARENAELDAAWKTSMRELAESRLRLASASDRERRKLERDLHDGAQQHLVAASINLTLADEASDDKELHARISDSRREIEDALIELREISHGIYPTALARSGLSRALNSLADRYHDQVFVAKSSLGRFSPEIELAIYYCGLEAVQNASKHAGPDVRVWIRLYVTARHLHLEVHDNGRGFDPAHRADGVGLQNMRDRLDAVGGRVEVTSEPGKGTHITATVPITNASGPDARH